jgi:transcriptional regulator with XRE-family HTH domain
MKLLQDIDLELSEILSDPEQRHAFFRLITQDEIASQIRALRKERGLTQAAFAELADMKQSAVSRIEKAEYAAWNLTTLFRAGDALDARWVITLEPCEAAIAKLQQAESAPGDETSVDGVRVESATHGVVPPDVGSITGLSKAGGYGVLQ